MRLTGTWGDATEGPVLFSNDVGKKMMDRMSVAIFIGIAVVVSVGAAGTLLVLGDSDEGKFTLTYHMNGNKVSEKNVSAGTQITIAEEHGGRNGSDRFVGWNTRSDMSGTVLLPGNKLRVEGNTSLYAMMASSGMFAVVLPEKRDGFSITADPLLVRAGGSTIITYSVMPSHIEKDLVIAVNGNPMKLDAIRTIHIFDINEDKYVTVTGVHDRREHSISLPESQIGYVLTSSEEKVHHGESYCLEYRLLPGYRETSEFGIHLNGVDTKRPADGTVQIADVRDNHRIIVTGVEPIVYSISAGKNISVTVNGAAASGATVEDLITVRPADGYSIPSTFGGQIKGQFKTEGGRYRIASDIVFPSVLKVTAGDNVRMDGASSKTAFVCPDDKVKISASSGYSLPDSYDDRVKGLRGVRYSSGGFSFGDDTALPSIYKVVFNGHNTVHATFFVIGGDESPATKTSPQRDLYHFNKWQAYSKYVFNDLQINAVWSPNEYTVSFGKNLFYTINEKLYNVPGSHIITTDDTVTVSASAGYELPINYLPPRVFVEKKNGYIITSDYTLADIYFVQYKDNLTGLSKKYFLSDSDIHTIVNPRIQSKPSFTFDLDNTGYLLSNFEGWFCDGQEYTSETIVVDRNFLLYAMWRE